jgi:hypothetical protein
MPIGIEPIHDAQPAPEAEPVPREHEPAPGGPIERLKAERRALQLQRTEEFKFPGYKGFYGRYRRLGVDEARSILNEQGASSVERHAQLLIAACDELFVRDEDGDTHVASGFDDELADHVEIEVDRRAKMGEARQVVLGVFDGNEHWLMQYALVVWAWMVTIRDEEDERALGESTGTPTSR